MKKLECFLKRVNVKKDNIGYVVSEDIMDEEGNPIEWELKMLNAKDINIAQDEALDLDVKTGDMKFNQNLYRVKVLAKSIAYPDLNNAELQNAYGVYTPEDLLQEMLNIGEYRALETKVNKLNGMSRPFKELKEEAKN